MTETELRNADEVAEQLERELNALKLAPTGLVYVAEVPSGRLLPVNVPRLVILLDAFRRLRRATRPSPWA